MISTLILTHGALAQELLAAAEVIAGKLDAFEALCLEWDDGIDEVREKIEASLNRLDRGDGVIILTDMFGGTPANIALEFERPGKVEVLSGVNLPMVLRLGCRTQGECAGMNATELAHWLEAKGRQSIRVVPKPAAAKHPATARRSEEPPDG